MFPINAAVIKAVALLLVVIIVASGLWYVTGLRADLVVSTENAKKLSDGIAEQQAAIQAIQQDQSKINTLNRQLSDIIKSQNKDLNSLRDRFNTAANGEKRDFGAAAAAKPTQVETAVNRGTANALRCLEIASGAPLTDREKNAKLPTEINKECPGMANPGYQPTAGI